MSVGRSSSHSQIPIHRYVLQCGTHSPPARLTQAPLQRYSTIKIQNASLTSENEKKVNSSDGFNMADDTRKVRVEEQLKVKIGRF